MKLDDLLKDKRLLAVAGIGGAVGLVVFLRNGGSGSTMTADTSTGGGIGMPGALAAGGGGEDANAQLQAFGQSLQDILDTLAATSQQPTASPASTSTLSPAVVTSPSQPVQLPSVGGVGVAPQVTAQQSLQQGLAAGVPLPQALSGARYAGQAQQWYNAQSPAPTPVSGKLNYLPME